MAYVPGYTHDVFVSYAHADNLAVPGSTGWVTNFHEDLKIKLKQVLHGANGVDVFLDKQRAEGGDYRVDQFDAAAAGSAIMVSIMSPAYFGEHEEGQQPFTVREFTVFCSDSIRKQNLFGVEIRPIPSSIQLPDAARGLVPMPFTYDIPGGGGRRPITRAQGTLYEDHVEKLANNLGARLLDLKKAQNKPVEQLGTVVLAEVTGDLEDQRDKIRSLLQPYGVRVLPENGDYPLGGDQFRAAFKSDLAQADLVVHLLSGVRDKKPPDVPEGFRQLQDSLTKESGKPVLRWRAPGVSIDDVADPGHKTLLANAAAEDPEKFQMSIVQKLRQLKEPPPPPPPPPPTAGAPKMVFINYHKADAEVAAKVREALKGEGHRIVGPRPSGKAAEIRQALQLNLQHCHALLLLYENATPEWVYDQLSLYLSMARTDLRLLARIDDPKGGKPDVGIELPPEEMQVFGLSELPELVSRLRN